MSVLLIAGSPSERSRSAALLDSVSQRLLLRGATFERLHIRDLSPQSLLLADTAHRTISAAIDQVARARAIVVATPVYKAAHSGVLKVFLDLRHRRRWRTSNPRGGGRAEPCLFTPERTCHDHFPFPALACSAPVYLRAEGDFREGSVVESRAVRSTTMSNAEKFALRRRFLKIAATTAAVWGVGARAQQSKPSEALKELRIGYQKAAVNLVILKQQAALEKRFPNAKVQWIEFPAGPQLLEALSAGSLEFGLTGDSPPVFAQAAGKDLLYVGAEPAKPESSAIVVLNESPIRTLSDLKGKKIALQKGSSAHYLLVRAVEKAGLQWSDIQPIYLAPADARAAFERKAVDAWAIWDPFYAAVELALNPRLLLLDEPLGALDALTRIEIHQLIEGLWRRNGFTALLVTSVITTRSVDDLQLKAGSEVVALVKSTEVSIAKL
jgi:ABC-type amino acid transport substrate-binding protein/multimeric flavodoxin WrbA